MNSCGPLPKIAMKITEDSNSKALFASNGNEGSLDKMERGRLLEGFGTGLDLFRVAIRSFCTRFSSLGNNNFVRPFLVAKDPACKLE